LVSDIYESFKIMLQVEKKDYFSNSAM